MIRIGKSHIRVVPQIRLALEAVRLGEIEAREAFSNLILDAEILIDDAELQKIRALPEIAGAINQAPDAPPFSAGSGKSTTRDASIHFRQDAERAKELARVQMHNPSTRMEPGSVPKDEFGQKIYSGSDWRAKVPEIRKAQYKLKPAIDYIASTYKGEVMKAIAAKMASIPEPWRQVLLEKPTYRLETKGLQLSPTSDKQWKSIFVQVELDLGSYEDGTGFLGKLSQDFEQAAANNQVQEAADGIVWQSSLSGLETFFKSIDPFAGTKPSSHQIQGHDVARWEDVEDDPSASEPGYDLHVREGLLDQIQNALDDKLVQVLGVGVESLKISDDGVFVFKALPPAPATDPERMADDVEEPVEPEATEPPVEPTV